METRAFMEPRFGYDFSRVRLHSGQLAAASAKSISALAYTVGRDVVVGRKDPLDIGNEAVRREHP